MTQERFISLVRAEQEPLRRFLLALCGGDAALADDIAQDALVRAYVASGSFLGLSKFSTWLFRIAYNCYIDHSRKAKPDQTPVTPWTSPPKTRPTPLSAISSSTRPWTGFRRRRRPPSPSSISKTGASRRFRPSWESRRAPSSTTYRWEGPI